MTKMQRLEKYAKAIPSMESKKIGAKLREYVQDLPDGDIVEVGAWLGGCTAYLALGVIESKKNRVIQVYDRFEASSSEVVKADLAGMPLTKNMDTLGIFQQHLKPFPVQVIPHKGHIRGKSWNKAPIAMYIDDACKRQPEFDHVLDEFFPYIVPGGIVILMDYYYYLKRDTDIGLRYQAEVMMADKKYQLIDKVVGTSAAIFRRVK